MRQQNKIINKLAKGGSLAFTSNISSVFIGFITTLILTRYLGAHYFGIYALGMSVTRISSKLSILGMNNGILRFFPLFRKERRKLKGLLNIVFGTVITTAVFMTIMYIFTANFLAREVFNEHAFKNVMRICAIAIPFIACTQIIASIFQSEKDILKYVIIGDIFQKILYFIFLVLLTIWGINIYGAVFAYFVTFIVTFAIAIIYFLKYIIPLIEGDLGSSIYNSKELLQFSLPSFLIGFTYFLLTQIDRIMIGVYRNSYEVGIYVVSAKIALLLNIFLASFNTIFVPYISELYFANRKNELAEVFKVVTKWIWACSIILFAFFFFLGKPILTIFGKDFSDGWVVFILLSLFYLMNSAFGSNGFLLQMVGKQYIELTNCILVMIMNIILNIVLIPKFGIKGAALATGFSMIVINILRLVEIIIMIKIHPFSESYIKVGINFIVSSLIALVVNYSIKAGIENQIISFIIFSISYFSFMYFLCLSKEDELILDKIKEKLK